MEWAEKSVRHGDHILPVQGCGQVALSTEKNWCSILVSVRARVKLQVLLRKERRTPEGMAAVRGILESLGITPSASGSATVSATVEAGRLEAIFGPVAPVIQFQADTLPIPEALTEYVESITVAPKHIHMEPPGHP